MKTKNTTSTLLAIFPLVLALMVNTGQAQSLDGEPGYVDVAALEDWFDDLPTMEVNIKGSLLKLVAEASRYDDPELSETLNRLKAIQVRSFEVDSQDRDDIRSRSSTLSKGLVDSGWEVVVRVRDDEEDVHMYLKPGEESIVGLFVMVVDDNSDEAIFVNIVGEIDPEEFGRVGRKFNIGYRDR